MALGELVAWVSLVMIGSAGLSYILAYFSHFLAIRYQVLDIPHGERKIHDKPIPLWGGTGIALALGLTVIVMGGVGLLTSNRVSVWQLVGFLAGLVVLTVGGMLDDKYNLKPSQSILFPIFASLIVVISGTTIGHITHPGTAQAWFLDWWTWRPFDGFVGGGLGEWRLSLPSDLLTFVWILVATYATKISDGLDGLVVGIAIIGAGMVGTLSAMPVYYQPFSSLLAAAMVGSFRRIFTAQFPSGQTIFRRRGIDHGRLLSGFFGRGLERQNRHRLGRVGRAAVRRGLCGVAAHHDGPQMVRRRQG